MELIAEFREGWEFGQRRKAEQRSAGDSVEYCTVLKIVSILVHMTYVLEASSVVCRTNVLRVTFRHRLRITDVTLKFRPISRTLCHFRSLVRVALIFKQDDINLKSAFSVPRIHGHEDIYR